MHYEDVQIKPGDMISKLIEKYGHSPNKWRPIWEDPKNDALRKKRGAPERIQPSDVFHIPIPWVITSKSVVKNPDGKAVTCKVSRDGQKGTQIRWAQTVDQHNQPIGATSQKCVDACPPDDADPFYWTSAELTTDPTLRNNFSDVPRRAPPTAAQGTTQWRAVLSLVVATEKRVTIVQSIHWGFDITPAGVVTAIAPRAATAVEVTSHLDLLKKGVGTGGKFSLAGWTFRKALP